MAIAKISFDECFQAFPKISPPKDFEEFWQNAMNNLKKTPLEPKQKIVLKKSLGWESIWEISYRSLGGKTVKGILSIPRKRGKSPAVITFHDYRGQPEVIKEFRENGIAHLYIDLRDHEETIPSGPEKRQRNLFVDYGLDYPDQSYLFFLYMDAVRAVDFLRINKDINSEKIGLLGRGIGSAMAVFAASQRPENIAALAIEKHAFAHLSRWITLAKTPYAEEFKSIFLNATKGAKKLQKNLDYFDTLAWSESIHVPVLTTVSLQDEEHPAYCGFSFFNHLKTDKSMELFTEQLTDPRFIEQRKKTVSFLIEKIKDD